jgi:membrane-associated phospholipid phosphatase
MESRTELCEKRQTTYRNRMRFLAEHPVYTKILHIVNKLLTFTVFLLYPLLLAWLYFKAPEKLLHSILVPLDSFLVVTFARLIINRKRPYERYATPPAIPKSTSGKSFPSRHVFSASIIAATFFYAGINPLIGAAIAAAAVMLGVIRILSGVHFVSDVIAGIIAGILAGVIGYVLI